jgi:hypothetical protein
MFVNKTCGVVAAILAAAVLSACSNSVTGTDAARRDVQATASRDSTNGLTCLTGWIIMDGIASCPGGH